MSRGQNTIKRSEVSTTPILLKYPTSIPSASFSQKGITVNRGINSSYSSDGLQFLNYASVKQLYYQEYLTGSLLFSSSLWNDSLQSTAYGYDFAKYDNTLDQDYRYFPKSTNSQVTIIKIPRTVFGEQISRSTLSISGSNYSLVDDGNGNVLDCLVTGSKYYSTFGAAYGVNGIRLYDPGYTTNLVGTYISWDCAAVGGSYLGTFWTNPYQNTTDGRLNSTGFWSAQSLYAIGKATLEFNIVAPSNGTYHIGIGSDNYSSVYVDDVLVVTEVNDKYNHDNFKYWEIFPITLTSGTHKIKIEGVNNYDNPDNPSSMPGLVGIEVYNNTKTELSQSIASSPLGSSVPAGVNMLYSSKDYLTSAVFNTNNHVGNILYSQGVIVITEQNYINALIP